MPELKPQAIYYRAKDETTYNRKVKVSVTGDGEFSVELPDDLERIARKRLGEDMRLQNEVKIHARYGDKPRIRTKVVAYAINFLKDCARIYSECETVTERVIVYRTNMEVDFWIDRKTGTHLPHGAIDGFGDDGQWWTPKSFKKHSFDRHDYFSIGVVAIVRDRTSYKRETGVTYTWAVPEHDEDDPSVALLNGFRGVNFNPTDDGAKIMPYTPQAAQFFARMMLSLCKVAKELDEFFGDPEKLRLAIKAGGIPLLK
jgi:hypothetical protein